MSLTVQKEADLNNKEVLNYLLKLLEQKEGEKPVMMGSKMTDNLKIPSSLLNAPKEEFEEEITPSFIHKKYFPSRIETSSRDPYFGFEDGPMEVSTMTEKPEKIESETMIEKPEYQKADLDYDKESSVEIRVENMLNLHRIYKNNLINAKYTHDKNNVLKFEEIVYNLEKDLRNEKKDLNEQLNKYREERKTGDLSAVQKIKKINLFKNDIDYILKNKGKGIKIYKDPRHTIKKVKI